MGGIAEQGLEEVQHLETHWIDTEQSRLWRYGRRVFSDRSESGGLPFQVVGDERREVNGEASFDDHFEDTIAAPGEVNDFVHVDT